MGKIKLEKMCKSSTPMKASMYRALEDGETNGSIFKKGAIYSLPYRLCWKNKKVEK